MEEDGEDEGRRPEERVEMTPAKPKSSATPATHGMRRKPMANVTDPHSISAIDAPRSIDAALAGDMPPRGRRATGLRGESTEDAAATGAMMVTSSVQRSRISRESWSPLPPVCSMASLRVAVWLISVNTSARGGESGEEERAREEGKEEELET